MLTQEELNDFKTQADLLRSTFSESEQTDPSFLPGFAQLACRIGGGSQTLMRAIAALSDLGEFRAEEVMPDQWIIESGGKVMASGPTFVDAALALVEANTTQIHELASLEAPQFP